MVTTTWSNGLLTFGFIVAVVVYDRSFCIQNRNQSPIFVSDIGAETFFAEFLMFSFFFGEFKFWKAWNWAQIYQKKTKNL